MNRVARQAVIPALRQAQDRLHFGQAGMTNPYIPISNDAVIKLLIAALIAPNDWTCGESVLYSSHE